MTIVINSIWPYVEAGNWNLASDAASRIIELEPNRALHFRNRGMILFALHRIEDALADFEKANYISPGSETILIHAGVALWWLGQKKEAIERWRQALDATYRDAGGGMTAPSVLYYAATRLFDSEVKRLAVEKLMARWKPNDSKRWPNAIAGFLLGDIDEATFLTKQRFQNSVLEARRLCKVHFWLGTKSLLRTKDEFLPEMKLSVEGADGVSWAVRLESEFWLASAELEAASP